MNTVKSWASEHDVVGFRVGRNDHHFWRVAVASRELRAALLWSRVSVLHLHHRGTSLIRNPGYSNRPLIVLLPLEGSRTMVGGPHTRVCVLDTPLPSGRNADHHFWRLAVASRENRTALLSVLHLYRRSFRA